jgi:flagellar biosynthesis protein FliQ
MNQIFYLLWLSDVVDALSTVLGFVLGCFFVALFIYIVAACVENVEGKTIAWLPKIRKVTIGLAIGGALFPFLPSKATVQAAAIAQAGAVVAQSPLGQNAIDALNRVLKKIGN